MQNFSVEEKRLINVATIRSALGYRFRITGVGLGEARDLALLLRAGALAAPMYIVEERTVGASLGEDNIRAGLRRGDRRLRARAADDGVLLQSVRH